MLLLVVVPPPGRAEADAAGVPRRALALALARQPLPPGAVVAPAEAVAEVLALALARRRPQPPPERPPPTVDDVAPEAEQPQRVHRLAAHRPQQPGPGHREARAVAAVMGGEAARPVAEPRRARAAVPGTASA